jgi:ankyrin repeat protein
MEILLKLNDLSPGDLNTPYAHWGDTVFTRLATGYPKPFLDLAFLKGGDPNRQAIGHYGNTPLTWAIANNAKKTAMDLITICGLSIDLNKASKFNGNTPIILSIAKGHERAGDISNFELTKFLLARGADPNKPDVNGFTPMHYAFLRRDPKTVDLLLEHGGRLDIPNTKGLFPEDMLVLDYDTCKLLVYTITDASQDEECCSFPPTSTFMENKLILQTPRYKRRT